MAQIPLLMPQLGESIAEATIVKILQKEGSAIEADSDVIEVETNKAIMAVTAPCTGTLAQIDAVEGESYPVGAALGYIEVSAEEARRLGIDETPSPEAPRKKPSKAAKKSPAPQQVEPTVKGLPVPAHAGGGLATFRPV